MIKRSFLKTIQNVFTRIYFFRPQPIKKFVKLKNVKKNPPFNTWRKPTKPVYGGFK